MKGHNYTMICKKCGKIHIHPMGMYGRENKWGKHTEESKKKIKIARTKQIITEKTRLKMSKSRRGYKHPIEVKKKISEGRFGENNPAWTGGKSFEPYTKEFNKKFKKVIRKRDNYICMKCGKHQEKENRSLSIHHINYDKKLTIPQNCVSLCRKCNSEVNENRTHWIKFFQFLLSEKYKYKYNERNEIILEYLE